MADLFDPDPPPPPPAATHVCGAGGIYYDHCHTCLVAEIAMMPRRHGQQWLRAIKAQYGRAHAERLGREIIAYRESWRTGLFDCRPVGAGDGHKKMSDGGT